MRRAAAAIGILLACWLCWRVVRLVDAATTAIFTATTVLSQVPAQVSATREALTAEMEAIRMDADYHLQEISRRTLDQTGVAVAAADRRLGQGIALIDARTSYMASSVAALQRGFEPTLENSAAITAQAKDASEILFRRDALPAQLLGVLGGAKVTLGQTALTMRSVEQAMPKLLETAQALEENSNETTVYSAALMKNLTTITKPVLPWWARVGLAVAPPAAQTGFTVASWAALKGKTK